MFGVVWLVTRDSHPFIVKSQLDVGVGPGAAQYVEGLWHRDSSYCGGKFWLIILTTITTLICLMNVGVDVLMMKFQWMHLFLLLLLQQH